VAATKLHIVRRVRVVANISGVVKVRRVVILSELLGQFIKVANPTICRIAGLNINGHVCLLKHLDHITRRILSCIRLERWNFVAEFTIRAVRVGGLGDVIAEFATRAVRVGGLGDVIAEFATRTVRRQVSLYGLLGAEFATGTVRSVLTGLLSQGYRRFSW